MIFEIAIVWLVGFFCMAFFYWDRFFEHAAKERRWFIFWFVRGAAIPIVIWFFFNAGFFNMTPILPDVEVARSTAGGKWVRALLSVTARGIWIIGSYWCAITFCWLAMMVFRRVEPKKALRYFWVCSLFTLPLAFSFLVSRGLPAFGLAFVFWLLPLVHFALPLLEKEIFLPSYSAAMAKMQMGRYEEAELEVIRQLEMCEEDFDGWMMLAALYAEQHKDLPVAEKTIFELCAQPNVNMSQVSAALNRLADWYLKLAEEPVAARRVLDEIGKRFPGSHVAKMTELRLKKIPATKEELLEQKKPRALHLPSIGAKLFEAKEDEGRLKLSEKEAAALANKLAAKLKTDPNDVRNREEFARLLAEQLGKVDPAIDQIKMLLELPEQPAMKRAEWFGLLASWELKYRRDEEAARRFLEKVMRDFAKTPQAFAAERQLNLLDVEARLKKAKPSLPPEMPKIQVS
jgi:hypothetical protein